MGETVEEHLKKLTNKQLIKDVNALYEVIHVFECYGTKDLMWLELEMGELERRGYSIEEDKRLKIRRGRD